MSNVNVNENDEHHGDEYILLFIYMNIYISIYIFI